MKKTVFEKSVKLQDGDTFHFVRIWSYGETHLVFIDGQFEEFSSLAVAQNRFCLALGYFVLQGFNPSVIEF